MTDKRNDTHDIFVLKECVKKALVKCNTRLNIEQSLDFDIDLFLEIAFGIHQINNKKTPTLKESITKAKEVWYPFLLRHRTAKVEANELLNRWGDFSQ